MNKKIIRTNDRCQKCDGFLIFEVGDVNQDKNNSKILFGIWICTMCGAETPGLWVDYKKEITKKKEDRFCERCGKLIDKSFNSHNSYEELENPP